MFHMTRFDAFQTKVQTNLGLKRVKTHHMFVNSGHYVCTGKVYITNES